MKKNKIIVPVAAIVLVICGVTFAALITQSNKTDKSEKVAKTNNDNESIPELSSDKKMLVTYFSVPETDDPNNMTTEEDNSTVVVNGEVLGNTQYTAMLISDLTNADLYRIEPETPYTKDHDALVDLAREEQDNDTRPALKDEITNFDEYDIIFVGYPVWWSDMPQILYTFLEAYDFEGKTVIPFSTHGGSGLAGTVEIIQNKLNDATLIENALSISRNDMEGALEKVQAWLQELNILN